MKVSVLILTKNEEQDLPRCLSTLAWADDVWVLDSISDDQTVPIAKEWGANVISRPFDNWSDHQNWAIRNIPFKHTWVLYLDADERATTRLAETIHDLAPPNNGIGAFRIRRRDFYKGRWLKHVQASPYFIRVFQPSLVRYERLVNPVTVVEGAVFELEGFIDHFPFSKGLTHWVARHNGYSSLEAMEIKKMNSRLTLGTIWQALTESDFTKRRVRQKEVFYALPGRPIFKFILLYLLRGGFLDGIPGFQYAVLQTFYESLICMKTEELRRKTAFATDEHV